VAKEPVEKTIDTKVSRWIWWRACWWACSCRPPSA